MATLLSSSSLKNGTQFGNASASSLIKSATSLASEINTFNDTQARIDYANSAKTDDDLESYLTYLKSRVSTLESTGSVTDATKALNVRQEMVTATHSNMSSNILRENIAIMTGTATPTDKLNLIQNQYTTALSIGDTALAQQLESQAYSLSQTIQNDAQTAATAASTLAKAQAGNQESVVSILKNGLTTLNQDIKNGGVKTMNATLQAWVKQNSATLQTLGVKLDSQPNYFDIVNGVAGAMYNAHMLAYQSVKNTDPYAAQTYLDSANGITNGSTKLQTLGGSLNVFQVQNAAASPAEFAYDAAKGTLVQTKQTGFDGYANGQPVPTYSGTTKQTVFLSPTQTAQMHALGLNFTENTSGKNAGTTGNGVQVQATGSSPDWLKAVLGPNGVSNMYTVDNSDGTKSLQFEGDSSTGMGKAYYTLGTDSRGLMGLFQNTAPGQTQLIGGEYGFNASAVQYMINNATAKDLQVQQQAAQTNLKMAQTPILPTITPQTQTPPQNISIAPPPQLQSVNPNTINPQKTAPSTTVQPGGGGINIQGGGAPGSINLGTGYLGGGNIKI